jgi:hypothetical protein
MIVGPDDLRELATLLEQLGRFDLKVRLVVTTIELQQAPPELRLTEDGQARLTENGEARLT